LSTISQNLTQILIFEVYKQKMYREKTAWSTKFGLSHLDQEMSYKAEIFFIKSVYCALSKYARIWVMLLVVFYIKICKYCTEANSHSSSRHHISRQEWYITILILVLYWGTLVLIRHIVSTWLLSLCLWFPRTFCLRWLRKGGLRLAQKVKIIVNEVHENLHIYCGHLELSLVKNSGGCSAPFLRNHFLKLTNFTVSRVAVFRPCTALW